MKRKANMPAKLKRNTNKCVCRCSCLQKRRRKWARVWPKSPIRRLSGRAPCEHGLVSIHVIKNDSSYQIRTFGLIVNPLVLSGNGTLNKQAGIDYKQLSLLAKINENQSGEVSWISALGQASYIYYFSAPLVFNRPCALCAVMAGALARGRDHREGSAGERLDHQEEQRLQRGASETQVTHAPELWQRQSAAVGFHLAHLNRLCRLVNTALGRDWLVASCATRQEGFF